MTSFDSARYLGLLRSATVGLGQPVTVAAVTGSTNDDALSAARSGAPAGSVFVADRQTHGRGRSGRAWLSQAGQNLTFSILLRPTVEPAAAGPLALIVGLAVREAAAGRVLVPLLVKWPNDIVADSKKLSGILVQSQLGGRGFEAVVGVGVNVSETEFPSEISAVATSLARLGAPDLSREALLVDILSGLERRLRAFERGDLIGLVAELRQFDALRGRRVSIDGHFGVARGIDASGALLLEAPSGAVERIVSGSVEWA